MDESIYKHNKELIISEESKELYEQILTSSPIYHLIHSHSTNPNTDNCIVNLRLSNNKNLKQFSFDIVDSLTINIRPWYIYHIDGSLFKHQSGTNLIYKLTCCDTSSVIGTYIDKTTIITDNVFLNEISKITSENKVISQLVKIVTNCDNSREEIIIDPKNSAYKLYSKGQIDINTFYNLLLLSLNNSPKSNEPVEEKHAILKRIPKLIKTKISKI